MGKKLSVQKWNPDFRHRLDIPLPPVEELEKRMMEVLTPATFAPLREKEQKAKLRDRVLVLPVMAAIVVSLVWRKIPSLAEVLRLLAMEGLLWVEAGINVSRQALSKRLEKMPAELFANLFAEVLNRMSQERAIKSRELPGEEAWAGVLAHFGAIYIADGSTLESLKKRLKNLREQADIVLGGKMMMVVEALRHGPVAAFYTRNSDANDKTFIEQLQEVIPKYGLVILDMGFFSFAFFDQMTDNEKYFITRLREKSAYRTLEILSQGPQYRDEIIQLGMYRSNPCKHKIRLVSVLWGTVWYRYITNVLDDKILSARQVCELYRRRWRIEEAFLLTKRLLGLSYLWVGGSNGVEIQIYATWIFYAILTDLCQQVACALKVPLERISVEMVFRAFYHYSRAVERGENPILVTFIAQHAKLFGIVKAVRKRQRDRDFQMEQISFAK